MAEVMHPKQSTQAATEKAEQKQIAFRYAPSFLPRFLFIDAHQNEKHEVRQDEIYEHWISHCFPYPWLCLMISTMTATAFSIDWTDTNS